MTRTRAALLVLCLALGALPAAGQRASGSLTFGASRVRFAESDALSAMSVSPAFQFTSPRTLLTGTAVVSRLDGTSWSSQGALGASLFTNITPRGSLGELAASGGGSSHSDGASTSQWLVSVRGHLLAQRSGVWLGMSGGSQSDGVAERSLLQGEVGAALRREGIVLVATVQPTRADTLEYVDLRGGAEIWRGAFELSASAGARGGAVLPPPVRDARQWGSVSLRWWFASRWALEAGGGTYPVDLTQGFPSGRFASIGLRLGGRRHVEPLLSSVDPRDRRAARAAGLDRFEVATVAGRQRLRVLAPQASRVEVNGDFTRWTPVALRRASAGWWELEVSLSAGAHEVTVRVDGGRWLVPPGLATVTDEFGGRVGRLLVTHP